MPNAELKDAISSLLLGMLSGQQEKAKKSKLYQYLIENPKLLSKPDHFYYSFIHESKLAIEAALTAVKGVPAENSREYADIFQDVDYYEGQIENLCSKFEGSACCADKSGVLVGRYLNYLITGDKGTWETDDPKCYWLPRFGTQEQWMSLIHGMWVMRYGNPRDYLLAYHALLEAGEATLERGGEQ